MYPRAHLDSPSQMGSEILIKPLSLWLEYSIDAGTDFGVKYRREKGSFELFSLWGEFGVKFYSVHPKI